MASNILKILDQVQKKHKGAVRDPATAGIIERLNLKSPKMNYLFGGGFPKGRIVRFHGPESGGKTTISTYIASIVQKQPEQNIVVFIDFERTFDIHHAKDLGMDVTDVRKGGKFLFLRPENGEEGFTIAEELVRTKEVGLVIIDSDTTMPTNAMIESEYGKANFGGSSKLMSEALRKFNILLEKFATPMVIVSQERANMSLYGADFKVAGGFAQRFYSSHTNRVTKVEFLKEKGVVTGIVMRVKNQKSKVGMPFREVLLTLDFKKGFNIDDEYIEFMVPLGLVKQAGAYFKSEQFGFNCQGKAKLLEWFKENPNVYEDLKIEIDRLIAMENTMDAENESPIEEEVSIPDIPDPSYTDDEDQAFKDLAD